MYNISCPSCDNLILDDPTCASCGRRRWESAAGTGEPLWKAALKGKLRHKPPTRLAIAGDAICLCTADGMVVALDLTTGKRWWEHRPGPELPAHGLATDGTRLFVSSVDDEPIPRAGSVMVALDAASGEELWRFASDAHSLSGPAVAGEIVVCTSSDQRLLAIDAESGEETWTLAHPLWGHAAPAATERLVCAGGRGNLLIAYDLAEPRERWRLEGEDWFVVPPAAHADLVVAVEGERTLHALDAADGAVRWRIEGERGQGFTSPPVIAADQILIGSRLYTDPAAREGATYGLVALSAEDGVETWRLLTPRPITAPPAVTEGLVFVGTGGGHFHVVEAESGAPRWQRELVSRTVAQPVVSGDAVYVGQRDGTLCALRWRETTPDELPDPQTLLAEGDVAGAAVAYALGEDYAPAAALYAAELDQPRTAAQLYERAGQPLEAARLWEALDEWERAGERYAEAGRPRDEARMLERGGKPLEAARVYEAAGDLAEAARLFEAAGDRHQAATLYVRLGEIERARAIFQSLGDWERESQTLIEAGEPAEAAALLETHGRLERAADLYEQSESWEAALALRERLDHWEKVVELAERLDAFERLARARERLGQPRRAAEAYEHAAERLAAADEVDDDRVAALYEAAARHYHTAFEEERAADCEREIRRYRHLPDLVVRVEEPGALVEHHWTPVKILVENRGHGRATAVRLSVESEFFTGRQTTLRGLSVGRRVTRTLHVRPNQEDYGRLPLDLRVTYGDDGDGAYEVTESIEVDVIRADQHTPAPTPAATPVGPRPTPRDAATAPTYLNFDLRLTREGDAYRARVNDSPVGQAEELVRLDVGPGALDLRTGAGASRRLGDADDRVGSGSVTEVGRNLFAALFSQRLLIQWRRSLDRAHDQGAGLRLRLWLTGAPELATMPWEALYDAENDQPLALSRDTPIVRYLERASGAIPLGVRPPLRLLALLSDPMDMTALDVEGEWRQLQEALTGLEDKVEAERVERARLRDLRSALRAREAHILHYVGHGAWNRERSSAEIILEDDVRHAHPIPSSTLGTHLSDQRSLRLVVLNACEGAVGSTREAFAGAAQQLVQKGIPAVIAMQAPISDRAAIAFAGEFYGALADGDPVDAALAEARKAIHAQGSDEWVLPVLFMRAADSMLFTK